MTFRERQGDLFASGEPCLAHGCNLEGVMGAGIAVGFKERWPEMFDEYKRRCDVDELALSEVFPWFAGHVASPLVLNLMTQPVPGPHAVLSAVDEAVKQMFVTAAVNRITSIGVPRIGCGIGGLDWETEVKPVMQAEAAEWKIDLTVYSLGGSYNGTVPGRSVRVRRRPR